MKFNIEKENLYDIIHYYNQDIKYIEEINEELTIIVKMKDKKYILEIIEKKIKIKKIFLT